MVLGLMSSPIRMIFSLLLMQGISLTMFRAFLNQAIQRVDPLKFQFNLGNTNLSSSQSPSPQLPLSSFNWASLFAQPSVPIPAPLVDQRVLDLVHLIRAIQTPIQPSSNNQPSPISTIQVIPPPVMSAPIITLNTPTLTTTASTPSPVVHLQPSPAATFPQFIILPQYMKTSASTHVKSLKRMALPFDLKESMNLTREKPNEKQNKQLETKKKLKKKNRSKKGSTKRQHKKAADDLIVFEAVGWNDKANGGDDEN